jgi:hypothetical protein
VRVLWSAIYLGGLLVGCVGGAGEYQWRFYDQYASAKKHRQALTELRPGMSQSEVRAVLGEPEMVEGYPREVVWYYRTSPTPAPAGSADTDFTPLVFNAQQRLVRWGPGTASTYPGPLEPVRFLP